VSETGLSTLTKWASDINLTRVQNGFKRLVSLVLEIGFVRLVSQGPKKVSETGLSTLTKWASDINLARVQNGFERLVSLVYKKHLKRLVSDIY